MTANSDPTVKHHDGLAMGSGVYNTIAGLWYKVDHVEYEVTARFPLPHRQVSPNPVGGTMSIG